MSVAGCMGRIGCTGGTHAHTHTHTHTHTRTHTLHLFSSNNAEFVLSSTSLDTPHWKDPRPLLPIEEEYPRLLHRARQLGESEEHYTQLHRAVAGHPSAHHVAFSAGIGHARMHPLHHQC